MLLAETPILQGLVFFCFAFGIVYFNDGVHLSNRENSQEKLMHFKLMTYIVFETTIGDWFPGHFIGYFNKDYPQVTVKDVTSRAVKPYAFVLEVSGMDMSAANFALTKICKKMHVGCTSGVFVSNDVSLSDDLIGTLPESLPGTHNWLQ